MPKNAILYCFLIYLGFYTGVIDTTHFEGGTITYKILNTTGSVVTIVLTQTYIYDYTKITCTNSMIANQSPKLTFNSGYLENSQKVNCIQYCNQFRWVHSTISSLILYGLFGQSWYNCWSTFRYNQYNKWIIFSCCLSKLFMATIKSSTNFRKFKHNLEYCLFN